MSSNVSTIDHEKARVTAHGKPLATLKMLKQALGNPGLQCVFDSSIKILPVADSAPKTQAVNCQMDIPLLNFLMFTKDE